MVELPGTREPTGGIGGETGRTKGRQGESPCSKDMGFRGRVDDHGTN